MLIFTDVFQNISSSLFTGKSWLWSESDWSFCGHAGHIDMGRATVPPERVPHLGSDA